MAKDLKRYKGGIFIVSGPSGCGKTTLCKKLLKNRAGLIKSVSVTTRLPRKGEKKGADYIYVSEDEFKRRVKAKEFLEYANVFGEYYGTPKKPVLSALRKGKGVLLSIDVQGAAKIKRLFKDAVLIFILPPSFSDLKKRLLKRSSDDIPQIKKRLRIARKELGAIGLYDYAVVNDDMAEATRDLKAIITADYKL